ncbi:MAG: hypothetical protein QOE15_1257, partial [Acidimicrobiaceae bacterium]|nr:hypothetical protein [Acidimicrobiaceae bacterium]
YRDALSLDHAVGELRRMAGTQFDPEVVDAFVPLAEEYAPPGLPQSIRQP